MSCVYMNFIGKYIINKYLSIVCLPETRMCVFFEIIFMILYLKICQILAILFYTTYTITNCTNKTLNRFFNKGKEYILLLIFLLCVDISVNYFSTNLDNIFRIYDFAGIYNLYFSPSLCYFLIFLVILIHRIVQKLKSKLIHRIAFYNYYQITNR